ncbi:MAG: N-acetylmuramoyl-L-alanine amidase, partial [Gemmatimonadota bacterium]|nr:N-acetylmuramoyl-L-alanine amidase [Gemmatimonadota bacterium]
MRLHVRVRLARLARASAFATAFATAFAAVVAPGGVGAAEVRHEPPPGYVIRVKGVGGDTVVQLVPTVGGGMVRADLLARLLGGTCDSIGVGRWRLSLYGTALEIQDGAPFAAYGGFTLPLIEATRIVDGAPHVSLQLFSEIIPRFGIGILWDRERSEVRLFQSIARRSVPAAGAEAPGVAAVQPAPAPTPVVTAATSRTPARNANGLTRRYTVVVDAGHGGRDPGNPGSVVNGRRVREAELTLAMATRLRAELEKRGIDVFMTRTADTLIGLYDRGPMANARRGDLFISIHTNAANPAWKNASGVRGFETYFLSTARLA